jgi:hypothetical protein
MPVPYRFFGSCGVTRLRLDPPRFKWKEFFFDANQAGFMNVGMHLTKVNITLQWDGANASNPTATYIVDVDSFGWGRKSQHNFGNDDMISLTFNADGFASQVLSVSSYLVVCHNPNPQTYSGNYPAMAPGPGVPMDYFDLLSSVDLELKGMQDTC